MNDTSLYTPPVANVAPPTNEPSTEFASHKQRLIAAAIDIAIFLLFGFLYSFAMEESGYADLIRTQYLSEWELLTRPAIVLPPFLMVYLLHTYSLVRNSQTLGKRVCGIRIANLDDSTPNFLKVIFVRQLPVIVMAYLPSPYGILLCAVDLLFIFRSDGRSVHDLIAKTKVVQVKRQVR